MGVTACLAPTVGPETKPDSRVPFWSYLNVGAAWARLMPPGLRLRWKMGPGSTTGYRCPNWAHLPPPPPSSPRPIHLDRVRSRSRPTPPPTRLDAQPAFHQIARL